MRSIGSSCNGALQGSFISDGPDVRVGDNITIKTWDKSPEIGDVIVFHPPLGAMTGSSCGGPRQRGEVCTEPTPTDRRLTTVFVKRVVAAGGDTFQMEEGEAITNGEAVTGDWETRPCRGFGGCDLPRRGDDPRGSLLRPG